ncbi:MAG: universal stress protein [Deltaproteobacteria bacterium]|nr:universal stress protein [Deltaproteobacteria bacterium]
MTTTSAPPNPAPNTTAPTTVAPLAPRHLLVCVDVHDESGCQLAHGLVQRAAVLARSLDARMTVFSVVPPLATPAVPPSGWESPAYKALLEAAMLQSESWRRIVLTLAERAQESGVKVDHNVLEADGRAADLIVAAAGTYGADLIVMASHSRRGLAHALLGSVAERTAARSPVPVVIVPRAALG